MADIQVTETTVRRARGFQAVVGVDAGATLAQAITDYNPLNQAFRLTVPTGKKIKVTLTARVEIVDELPTNQFQQR